MIFIDCFLHKDSVILWCKEGKNNRFFRRPFRPFVFFEPKNEQESMAALGSLASARIVPVRMKHMDKGEIGVLQASFLSPASFRRDFPMIEKTLRGKGTFYGADLPLEEMFLFSSGLFPLAKVDRALKNIDDTRELDYEVPDLRVAKIRIRKGGIEMNRSFLSTTGFKDAYSRLDPDVLFIDGRQGSLIALARSLGLRLSRFGPDPDPKRPGSSFLSYGVRHYREAPLRLKGRLIINASSFMDESFTLLSVLEGARVCRMTIQRLASRSVGAAITNLLSWQAASDGYLLPYHSGFAERIRPFRDLVAIDRGAFTLEPEIGMHEQVAELDFVSMFPSIISRYNLSPETLGCACCPENTVPGTRFHTCRKRRGVVPKVCDSLMTRRAGYKARRDLSSRSKVEYLKWLLVVIFGFQGCSHKKIGRIEIHEAINAVARETILAAMRVAESRGYAVLHAIVDSLYLSRPGIHSQEGRSELSALVEEIDLVTGLRIELKAVYSRISFLPSVNDPSRPVPASYFGITAEGDIKVRGIEIRQRSAPKVVKDFQEEALAALAKGHEPRPWLAACILILRRHLAALDSATPESLAISVRLGREEYRASCPQKAVVSRMREEGTDVMPGMTVRYIIEAKGRYRELSCYRGVFDNHKYASLLKKALLRLFLPFGVSLQEIGLLLAGERQAGLDEYIEVPLVRGNESKRSTVREPLGYSILTS